MSLRVIVDPFFVSLSMHMREDTILAKVICVDSRLHFVQFAAFALIIFLAFSTFLFPL